MFEQRHQPVLPISAFLLRSAKFAGVAFTGVAISLGIGVVGYHITEGLSWLDSLLNASMILGGMGPVNQLQHRAGKIFASCYALFSGVVFLIAVGVLLAPWVHRTLHHFHLEVPGDGDS